MPFFKDNYEHGNLYIKFEVEFPKTGSLKKSDVESLETVFGKSN